MDLLVGSLDRSCCSESLWSGLHFPQVGSKTVRQLQGEGRNTTVVGMGGRVFSDEKQGVDLVSTSFKDAVPLECFPFELKNGICCTCKLE
ncbi:hypothetical protein AVEN_106303-1 [Araneus ventricosus]|uniref:Uncharacterized protein n=1 Tax=Araneus ventricosus TaxID=182803 RepID=A0A4Y2ASS1_ARAVE|nr:hypothetical protein AVEN_106303-1 [Araneus ventricosus]